MAISFPQNPTIGDIFTQNGRSWQWDGATWGSYGTIDDPGAFKVDPSNDRVGIGLGSATPSYTLDVSGDGRVSSDFIVGGNLTVSGTTVTLHVDSTNNRVGIGTTAPSSWLEIHVNSPEIKLTNDAVSVNSDFYYAGVTMQDSSENLAGAIGFISGEDQDMRITSYRAGANLHLVTGGANNNRVTITDTGNVGVGTTSPQANLSVGTGYSTFSMGANDSTGFHWAKDASALNLYTGAIGSGTYRFGITTDGNVGIGVNPSYKLDVNGDINATGDVRVGGVAINGNLVTGSTYYFTDNSQFAPEYGSNYYRTALYTVSAPSGKSISSVQLTVRSSAPAWVTITAQSSSSYSYYVWSKGASTGYVNYFLDCR